MPVVDMLSGISFTDPQSAKNGSSNTCTGGVFGAAKNSGGIQSEGVYVCVTGKKLAQLHLVSSVQSPKIDEKITKRVDTQAFARSSLLSFKIVDGQLVTTTAGTVEGEKIFPDPPVPLALSGISDTLATLSPKGVLYNMPANCRIVVGTTGGNVPGVGVVHSIQSTAIGYAASAVNGTSVKDLPSLDWTQSSLIKYYDSATQSVKLPSNQAILILDYNKYAETLKNYGETIPNPGNIVVLVTIR